MTSRIGSRKAGFGNDPAAKRRVIGIETCVNDGDDLSDTGGPSRPGQVAADLRHADVEKGTKRSILMDANHLRSTGDEVYSGRGNSNREVRYVLKARR